MAFSEEQKVRIRLFLGYPDVFRYANTRLENAIELVGSRPFSQASVEAVLANLADADAKVNNVLGYAGIRSADEVVFFGRLEGSSAEDAARRYGRLQCSRLSITLGVDIANDAFSERGYSGDAWGGAGFQGGGSLGGPGGGTVPMG